MTETWQEHGPWTVPSTSTYLLERAGRRWRVTVAETPAQFRSQGAQRVLYVLDPFGTFGVSVHVARTTRLLSGGTMPSITVVGVGPNTDDMAELHRCRNLDLTPWEPAADYPPRSVEVSYGGAAEFLELLCEVVAPYVEERHELDAADRTLAGWSLGGLFGAYALLERASAFCRYLLVSPSLYWGDDRIFHLLSETGDLDGPDIYLACGEHEEADRAHIVTNMLRFGDGLRSRQHTGLTVTTDVLAGEHHATVWPAAVSRGLLALHAPPPDLSPFDRGAPK